MAYSYDAKPWSTTLSIHAALPSKPRALLVMVNTWLEQRKQNLVHDARAEDLFRGRR